MTVVQPVNNKYTEANILKCLKKLKDTQAECVQFTRGEGEIQYSFIHALTMIIAIARIALEETGQNPDKVIMDMMNSNTDIIQQFKDLLGKEKS